MDSTVKIVPQISWGNIASMIVIVATVSVQWGISGARLAAAETRIDKVEKQAETTQIAVQNIDKQLGIIDERQKHQLKQYDEMRKILEGINDKLKAQSNNRN